MERNLPYLYAQELLQAVRGAMREPAPGGLVNLNATLPGMAGWHRLYFAATLEDMTRAPHQAFAVHPEATPEYVAWQIAEAASERFSRRGEREQAFLALQVSHLLRAVADGKATLRRSAKRAVPDIPGEEALVRIIETPVPRYQMAARHLRAAIARLARAAHTLEEASEFGGEVEAEKAFAAEAEKATAVLSAAVEIVQATDGLGENPTAYSHVFGLLAVASEVFGVGEANTDWPKDGETLFAIQALFW